MLDELDRLGLRENTIVVFWGDHGYHLGENGIWGKGTNFELTTRVPLILSAPGMKAAGSKTSALVELVDLYPTLSELAGLPVASELQGTSFAPLLDEPGKTWKKAAFSQYLRGGVMGRSIRTERWRFTRWANERTGKIAGLELYDQQNDPANDVNLAGREEFAELVGELSRKLDVGWRGAQP